MVEFLKNMFLGLFIVTCIICVIVLTVHLFSTDAVVYIILCIIVVYGSWIIGAALRDSW